jgi:hypothetical protein
MPKKIIYVVALVLSLTLAACGGGGSDSTVAAEFSVKGVKGTVSGQNVTLDLSSLGNCAVDIKALVVSINASGYSISPDPTAARDYSAPVEFTLTAPDGTKAVYKVTVIGASCGDTTPTPTPIACPTDVVVAATSKYSKVYKGCIGGVHTSYELTECVKDSTTGLTWQGHGAASEYTSSTRTYTNYDSLTTLQFNDIASGTYVAPSQAILNAPTNSIGLVNTANQNALCGYTNWRMPTQSELASIHLNIDGLNPRIDSDRFPNTVGAPYWTSGKFVEPPESIFFGTDRITYFLNFSAATGYASRQQSYNVRLVRSKIDIE